VNIVGYSDHRVLFHRMMEDGGIRDGEFGTKGHEKDISAMLRIYPEAFVQVFYQQLFWCAR